MNKGASVFLVVLLMAAGAVGGYEVGISNSHTATVTTTQTGYGIPTQCGEVTSCSAENPSGLVLTLSINTTSVKSNGSISIRLSDFNPTAHYINLSLSDNWLLDSLPTFWFCYAGAPPYGVAVFRGYYALQNVSSAIDVIHPDVYPSCIYQGNVTGFSIPPSSSQIHVVGTWTGLVMSDAYMIYAVDGGTVKMDDQPTPTGVYSLRSSHPAVYTIAAGDQWGALVLLHFSVVTGST